MNQGMKWEFVARLARQGLSLAVLLTFLLIGATVSHAQSSAIQAPGPIAKPAAVSVKTIVSPVEEQPAKGEHEGIVVHGHWMIEVKNPNGTVASHYEFENAIDPAGADVLTGLLSGQYVPQGFYMSLIALPDSSGNLSGLCGPVPGQGACVLVDTRATYGLSQYCTPADISNGDCGTLTFTPNYATAANGFTSTVGYTLSGNVTPKSSGQISTVISGELLCAVAMPVPAVGTPLQFSPQACFNGTTTGLIKNGAENLTSTTLAVTQPVTPPQSVSVTVAITFGSPSSNGPSGAARSNTNGAPTTIAPRTFSRFPQL